MNAPKENITVMKMLSAQTSVLVILASAWLVNSATEILVKIWTNARVQMSVTPTRHVQTLMAATPAHVTRATMAMALLALMLMNAQAEHITAT